MEFAKKIFAPAIEPREFVINKFLKHLIAYNLVNLWS